MRIVMHVDFDSFYASLEEQRKPEIKGKAVIICMYSGRGESGAVATANYKARELGIKSAMPIAFAKRRTNSDTIFLPVDLEYYRSISSQIMDVMESYADSFKQASIDEAYIDVSSCESFTEAEKIAKQIKDDIKSNFGITCSIGIGPNKLVAKMASRAKKPDGLTVVKQEDVKNFFSSLSVDKIHGIGGKTTTVLAEMGIETIEDLAKADVAKLELSFGKNKAKLLKEKALGIDESPVAEQAIKQMSRIGTLQEDTSDFNEIYKKVEQLATEMHKKIIKRKIYFRTVSIIIIGANIEMATRGKTIQATNKLEDILDNAKILLKEYLNQDSGKVRRAGIRISNLVTEEQKENSGLYKFFK